MPIVPIIAGAALLWAFNAVDDNIIDPLTGSGQGPGLKLGFNAPTAGLMLVTGAGAIYLAKR